MMSSIEEWLSKRDVRPTAVRILVLEYFILEQSAISLSKLENRFLYSDRSTLYRTLKTFENHGIIHTIDDGTGLTKYALCEQDCDCRLDEQHFHFHCQKCQETYCLNDQNVPEIGLPANFSLSQVNLVLKGLCANCN